MLLPSRKVGAACFFFRWEDQSRFSPDVGGALGLRRRPHLFEDLSAETIRKREILSYWKADANVRLCNKTTWKFCPQACTSCRENVEWHACIFRDFGKRSEELDAGATLKLWRASWATSWCTTAPPSSAEKGPLRADARMTTVNISLAPLCPSKLKQD